MIFNLSAIIVILILLIFSISKWKLHPFFALLWAAILLGFLVGFDGQQTIDVLLNGFSNTLKWIAIVVIFGAFIGEVLNETGGGVRISEKILKLVGQKKIPWAMGITGYIVSIPVFVDVAYILFQPVVEALSKKSKTPVLVVGLSLAAGLTVSHTLMPPTPGPIAVASLLNANIGRLLLINSFVAIFVVAGGVLWAKHFCKKFILDFDRQQDVEVKRLDAMHDLSLRKGSILLDLMPIIVPIILMGIGAFLDSNDTIVGKLFSFLSIPMVAVMIGACIAAVDYIFGHKKAHINKLAEAAIIKSALIIMITGAGGAFGSIIRESGVQESLGTYFSALPFLGFLLPFLLAAVLTSATGSITVSLIGAASILGSMSSLMPYSPEIMAALIGSGSFCVFHANSSFFWLLNRLHNIPIHVLYKTYTLQSLVMGLSGLIAVGILYLLGVR
ncbi:MAG: GntP family permease [Algibacter sp.]|uniref:GntP family permease n=1 Tax=Algibacter sp. TaxID=1872428 RepID=UPI002618E65C|nr:GntP family permease [Algibacter sp.]MDG1731257.1 GntP family permease [Algibacter sp.]MDG2178802.1 GntP family permease [Algibacter sp.]